MAFNWLDQNEVQKRRQAAISDGVNPKEIDEYISANQKSAASQSFQKDAANGKTWKQLFAKYGSALGATSDLKNFKEAAITYNSLSPHGPLKEKWINKIIGIESIAKDSSTSDENMF